MAMTSAIPMPMPIAMLSMAAPMATPITMPVAIPVASVGFMRMERSELTPLSRWR